jgi:predicted dehydrogenase
MALRMGKHVYCEKPLAHSVYETRLVTDTARQQKRTTQLGTQIHAGDNYRRVVELVQSGLIGQVGEVHVWVAVNYGKGLARPSDTPPVPETLNWDLWIGPAPMRPYHPCYHPKAWRSWWDFGCGGLGDFGCHYMDLPFWALKLKYPTTIEAEGPPVHPEQTSPGLTVRYEYPARADLPPAKMTWYDGGNQPVQLPDILAQNKVDPKGWRSGVLFVGDKGMVLANYGTHLLLPKDKFALVERPPKTIPDSVGHHQEWINACLQGTPTTCNFDYSGPLTETVLLGNVAYRTGEKIAWDAQNMKAINCPKAEAFLRCNYREGWSL